MVVSQKFDESASAEPYPFLGAVARSDAQLLVMTIDQMVSKANNVPKEEALTVWGLPHKSYDSLRSHSATDISELAFKYYGGDMIRFEGVVGVEIWKKWQSVAIDCRDAAHERILAIEAIYAGRELRKMDLTHSLFHLGLKIDAEGSVRNAMTYKTTLMATKAAKHFVETGKSSEGAVINSEEAAVLAAKKDTGKRKRVAPVTQKGDQYNVRYTMLDAQLKEKGFQMDSSQEERDFIERGPSSLGKIMSMIADLVHKRTVATA